MQQSTPGFLLTRHWSDRRLAHSSTSSGSISSRSTSPRSTARSNLELRYWVKTANSVALLRFTEQTSVFFIEADQVESAKRLLNQAHHIQHWEARNLALKSFRQQPITGFYFSQQNQLFNARTLLQQHQIFPLEADILPCDRFLMERFITGGLSFSGQGVKQAGFDEYLNPKIAAQHCVVGYRVLSLDIETSMNDDRLFSIGAVLASTESGEVTDKKVFMLASAAADNPPDYLEFFDSEKALLTAFLTYFNSVDPDMIIGWNVINFDLKFLDKKASQLKVPLTLGRNNTLPVWRASYGNSEHFTIKLEGRLVLDGIDTLRSATYSFESFALNAVANELLGRGKLIESHDRGQEIMDLFANDPVSLAAYNLEDCQLVWEIFVKADLINFSIQRAQLTGLAMDRFGGSVASFDNRYLPRLHRQGYVAPNIPQEPENIGSPGGYVMDSQPGIYNHVLVLDFKSLYPSIIRTFKIDPMALVVGLANEPNTPIKNQEETQVHDKAALVPGFNGAVFHKTRAILPDLIGELWQARDLAKQSDNAPMSQAIKILMNSFYGVLGTPGCRFFDFRLPSSITLRGHQILYQTKAVIEQKGFKVIYGDTDSVFVWLKGYHKNIAAETIQSIGHTLADELNQWWQKELKQTYQLNSFLDIEFETHFKRFIMPTIRGSEKGSKKRYAGIKTQTGSDDQLIFKGLESVRTDWTRAARNFQIELYQLIFDDQPYQSFILDYIERIKTGQLDDQLVYRKRIRRKLSDYQKNVPPHVQAARRAEDQLKAKGYPSRYKRGGWIEYLLTTNGPEPKDFLESPLDYELYIQRQIRPIADGILHFLDDDFNSLTDQQIALF